MLNLEELEQLTAFADCGTLSGAAERLHISQPTITRTMKHIEDSFGVPLFIRGKNKIELNETGIQAVEYARKLLAEARNAVDQVQAFDRKLHTITVEACAPVPLWLLLPRLNAAFPEKTIASRLSEIPEVISHVSSDACELGILPYAAEEENLACVPTVREELAICVWPNHELAEKETITFAELNGFHCLLRPEIGFWTGLCRQKMPDSKFLIQADEFAFRALVRESFLPCFTTNLARNMESDLQGRKKIPITDPEANVTYHILYRKQRKEYDEVAERMNKLARQSQNL